MESRLRGGALYFGQHGSPRRRRRRRRRLRHRRSFPRLREPLSRSLPAITSYELRTNDRREPTEASILSSSHLSANPRWLRLRENIHVPLSHLERGSKGSEGARTPRSTARCRCCWSSTNSLNTFGLFFPPIFLSFFFSFISFLSFCFFFTGARVIFFWGQADLFPARIASRETGSARRWAVGSIRMILWPWNVRLQYHVRGFERWHFGKIAMLLRAKKIVDLGEVLLLPTWQCYGQISGKLP